MVFMAAGEMGGTLLRVAVLMSLLDRDVGTIE